MTGIYLHNMPYRYREDAYLEWDRPTAELRTYNFWNIWRMKAVGWNIEDQQSILLVATWPGKGGLQRQFLWEVNAWNVRKWEGMDWEAATRELGKWSGEGTRAVRSSPYTRSKQTLQGPLMVLAWRADPRKWLNLPVPKEVRIGRNGWAQVAAEDVPGLKIPGLGSGGKSTGNSGGRKPTLGQGRRLDVASRDAVELRAMKVAWTWCRKQGWAQIRDTSLHHPWDYEAIDEQGSRRYVEVKGSTGLGQAFEVTAGEVNAAREHGARHVLIAVNEIKVVFKADGSVSASGGQVQVYDPWKPLKGELRETRYVWSPSEGG